MITDIKTEVDFLEEEAIGENGWACYTDQFFTLKIAGIPHRVSCDVEVGFRTSPEESSYYHFAPKTFEVTDIYVLFNEAYDMEYNEVELEMMIKNLIEDEIKDNLL